MRHLKSPTFVLSRPKQSKITISHLEGERSRIISGLSPRPTNFTSPPPASRSSGAGSSSGSRAATVRPRRVDCGGRPDYSADSARAPPPARASSRTAPATTRGGWRTRGGFRKFAGRLVPHSVSMKQTQFASKSHFEQKGIAIFVIMMGE